MGKLQKKIHRLREILSESPSESECCNYIIKRIKDGGGSVGKNFDVYSSFIDMSQPYLLSFGDDVTVTHATILTHDACLYKRIGYTRVGKVHIGNNVFIGFGAIILPGTIIGNNVVIGAGAVVSNDIPSDSVVVGNPCRILCSYHELLDKNYQTMREALVIDKYPPEVLRETEIIKQIQNKGKAYML